MLKFLCVMVFLLTLTGCSEREDISHNEIKSPNISTETKDDDINTIITPALELETKKELNLNDNELLENLNELCKSPRVYNTEDEQRSKKFLIRKMEEYGYLVQTQEFGVYIKSSSDTDFLKYSIEENRIGTAINVIGSSKTQSTKKTLYVTAHYDTTPDTKGIRDNGSGVATVLEIARQIREMELPINVIFVFFGAEEVGQQGSYYFVSQLTEEERANAIGCINFDCVGGRGDEQFVFNTFDEQINVLYLTMNENETFPLLGDNRSDHTPFQMSSIPSIFISDYTILVKDAIDDPNVELDMERLKELTETICIKIMQFNLQRYNNIIKESYVKEYKEISIEDPFFKKILAIYDTDKVSGYWLAQVNKILSEDGSRSDIQYILKNDSENQVIITEYDTRYFDEHQLDEIEGFQNYTEHIKYDISKEDNNILVRYQDQSLIYRYLILEGNISETVAMELLKNQNKLTHDGSIGKMLER